MKQKIDSLKLNNFGMITEFEMKSFSNLNLIIGENGTGKTFLLKAMYAAVKCLEEYQKGDDVRSINEILAEKLRWTFQTDKIGDIVKKSSNSNLSFEMFMNEYKFAYQFTRDSSTKIINCENSIGNKQGNSIFIPAKEVLSLYSIILKSREIDKSFGFDDTYYDLVKALRIAPKVGKNYSAFAQARNMLKSTIDGNVEFVEDSNKWVYKKGNAKFSIGATSEGVKKISILDRLFANSYLDKNSFIFIDELESALHPKAISDMLDMLNIVAHEMDIQIFIASHSYFVIKKLFLLAISNNQSIPCISLTRDGSAEVNDLQEGMPNNSIIDESIKLYQQEIDGVL